jgi:formylglycine-generating enzyme required for sulfatase activity
MTISLSAFVSHSHNDNLWCRPFVQALHDAGLDVWYDEKGLSGGAQWMATIEQELQTRDVFLLVLTPDAWESEWVQRELQLALVTKRIIVPIMLKKTAISGFLLTVQFIQATDGDTDSAAHRVLDMMRVPATPGKVAPVMTPADTGVQMHPPIARLHLPTEFATWKFQSTIIQGHEVIIPPICNVPAGSFIMGGGNTGDAVPVCEVDLPAFQIGQFPVTVAEYLCAHRAKAVPDPQLIRYSQATRSSDRYYDLQTPIEWQWQRGNLSMPIVGVTWNMALDYANWLGQITGQPWRLPTEAEWEKAAQGSGTGANFTLSSGQRLYPDQLPKLMNIFTHVNNNTSTYKVMDLMGNTWEWTSSQYSPYPYEPEDGREDLTDTTCERVLRGGSFLNPQMPPFQRHHYGPNSKAEKPLIVGFRLALG